MTLSAPPSVKKIAILGAGSWGTAVAIHLAKADHQVSLWGKDASVIKNMQITRTNERYLPGILFPETLIPEPDLTTALQADEICIGVPSHAFMSLIDAIPRPKQGLIWLTKGMDPTTQTLLSELVKKKWGSDYPCAIISGPSFAKEVAQGLPTALTLACDDAIYQKNIQTYFQHHAMRVYLSNDLVGVQLCGIVKNVLAIACGMSDALGFGANTKAALITRGLKEMQRLGAVFGAQKETFTGLAGLGDLVLTCTDNQSRNRRFGLALGEGRSPTQALQMIDQVVEGYQNASQVYSLAQHHAITMPISEAVFHVIQGQLTAKQAAKKLIERTSQHPYES